MKSKLYFVLSFLLIGCLLCGCTPTPSETEGVSDKETQNATENPLEISTERPTEEIKEEPKWKEDGVLRILTIGNSFSDDTMEYMYQIAKSAGVEKIYLGNLYIGGCSIDTHVQNAEGNIAAYEYRTNDSGIWKTTKNYRMGDALESQNWDFISMQQASGFSGKADSYAKLPTLISYVRSLVGSKPTLVWNMTWAYQQDSTHGDFPKYNSDQMTMYRAIVDTVEDRIETNKNISLIVPNGTAIQNARSSYIGDDLTRDGFHLTLDLGRYIAGLTMFTKLTGFSIENIKYRPASVDDDMQKVAVESAMNAVAEPRKVTPSKYSQLADIDLTKYTKLDIDWNIYGYWNSASGESLTTGTDDFTKKYCATAKMTKSDIPVGSIIVISNGWQYRPEGWSYSGTRPENVNTHRITVTKNWWAGYSTRAFNLSKINGSVLNGITEAQLDSIFTIYVPKN